MRDLVDTQSDQLVTEFEEPAATKRSLRAVLRGNRRRRTPAERQVDAELLARLLLEMPEVRAGRCIAAYASLPAEPGTEQIRAALRRRGVQVLLPVVLGAGTPAELDLDWAWDDGELAAPNGMGGAEPRGARLGRDAVGLADVVLTPALAIDPAGHRLGMGGGCYDRALRRVAADALVLAVTHDDEVLDDRYLPAEPHDVPVHAVLTPRRWIRFSPVA